MKAIVCICLTAVTISFLHDVVGPAVQLELQLEIIRRVESLKSDLELRFPDLRKEKL